MSRSLTPAERGEIARLAGQLANNIYTSDEPPEAVDLRDLEIIRKLTAKGGEEQMAKKTKKAAKKTAKKTTTKRGK